ncbi:unnamed protein product [Staurois parvus]|uniref:Uncharacterized protein n=1 Tax=Staurois parvus TaxID=386267 RepID=A0ABN9D4U5_9NEOB|nr:unnamed protein product [Staurois parvus]
MRRSSICLAAASNAHCEKLTVSDESLVCDRSHFDKSQITSNYTSLTCKRQLRTGAD